MLQQRRRSYSALWILSSWLPEVLMRGRSLPGSAVILRRFSGAENGSRPAAGERAFWELKDPVEPEERQRRRNQRQHRGGGGEQRSDFRFLLFEEELRVEVLVDLLEFDRVASVEVLAARYVGDRLQRLLVETHAHRPSFGADDLAAGGAHSHRVAAHAAVGCRPGPLVRVRAGGRLAVGQQDDGRRRVRPGCDLWWLLRCRVGVDRGGFFFFAARGGLAP